MSDARASALLDELLALPAETTWVEFKENNTDAEMIGKRISALSNSARLADRPFAYMLWGIRDADHMTIGTHFEPSTHKQSNQPLEMWLTQHLQPAVAFRFQVVEHRGVRLVLLEVPAATNSPVEFDRQAYIRIGSATPRLSDHPERLKALWARLQPYNWESGLAAQFLSGDDVLARLDYTVYFELTGQPLPDNRTGIFDKLRADHLIQEDVGGRWNIANLGAILFAKRLADFSPSLARKAVRFVAYDGLSRADTVTHRQDGQKGYATGFTGLIDYIDGLMPRNEFIGKAFREERPLYPAIAIRELVANALIHQDMTITGAGPLVEMFTDRIEITNPGQPLVQPERFLDFPPRSRNEALAALMRRMRLCEEQGTGIDKVIVAVELHQLPPPDFRKEGDAVRVVLYAPRRFAEMTPQERVRACYQHAALKYLAGQKMTNSTLRERFGIEPQNAAQASTVIRQALGTDLIRVADSAAPRSGYVPYWA
ncbi:MAG: MloB [Porticoccus sp.]|uniref:ATP-binding protein n=1 Tax=Porticoccus hydrocarbonoclasticus TaxID=1073414 RepID=UPI000C3A9E87|nr:ATP-binding protein [Porticoccus hydrocarbonoclasticus]MBG58805.1 MloB [Porticoccus sp.]|tara:strand:+ start:9118 stop:10572 length:1455 start_codon:yes stop_codon:yes gene_type:complete